MQLIECRREPQNHWAQESNSPVVERLNRGLMVTWRPAWRCRPRSWTAPCSAATLPPCPPTTTRRGPPRLVGATGGPPAG
eukprot:262535-Prorocentrum_minimum.AAC.1